MSHEQTARAIVEDAFRQLQEDPAVEADLPDRGHVQRVALETLDELRQRIATDPDWLDELIVEVRQTPDVRPPAFKSDLIATPVHGRRFDRRRVTVPVDVRIEGSDDSTLGLRDVGSGGFALVSRRPFSALVALFHFTLPTGETLSVEAEAVHCHLDKTDPEIQFTSGWRFTARNTPEVAQAFITAVTTPAPSPDV